MLLLYVSMLTVWTAGSTLGVAQAQQPVAQEQWVNPGVSIPPTTDLSKFVKKMDGAIVGTLERVSMVFLDPSDPNTLHTVLTFRMKEWLFGALPERAKTQIDVLLHGGTFVEQNGKRVPKQPTEVARNLTIRRRILRSNRRWRQVRRRPGGPADARIVNRDVTPRRRGRRTSCPQHGMVQSGHRPRQEAVGGARFGAELARRPLVSDTRGRARTVASPPAPATAAERRPSKDAGCTFPGRGRQSERLQPFHTTRRRTLAAARRAADESRSPDRVDARWTRARYKWRSRRAPERACK